VQPDETGAMALPPGGHQDVDGLEHYRTAQAMVHQRRRPGDEAARTGVEQGRHLLLGQVRCPGQAQVDAGQQYLPRAARPDAPLQHVVFHAEALKLPAADHGELLI
jgi:hypothetical protein